MGTVCIAGKLCRGVLLVICGKCCCMLAWLCCDADTYSSPWVSMGRAG